jgi:hypothetical protein
MTIETSRAAAAPASSGEPEAASRLKAELRYFLELFVLCGFVVAQPLFDVAGGSPDFFLFRRASPADILLLVALAVLGPALALWAGEVLVGALSRRLRRVAHLAVVAGLLLLLTIEMAKHLTPVRGVRCCSSGLPVGWRPQCSTPAARPYGCGSATPPRPRWYSPCCS